MSGVRAVVMLLGCVAAVGGWASAGSAQECSDDSGCPKGYSCEVTGVSGCAAAAPTPSGQAPSDGGAAADAGAPEPAKDGGSADAKFAPPAPPDRPVPECETKEYRSCVPGKCASDGDCAEGMVCHERTTGTCAGAFIAPCAPGSSCADAGSPPPACTETVDHICVPRYLLPCEKAVDCGDGFTCEPQLRMVCSGGTTAVDAGPAPAEDAGVMGAAGAGASGTAGAASSGSAGAWPPPPNMAAPAKPPSDGGMDVDAGSADLIAPPPTTPYECRAEPTSEKYCKAIDKDCKTNQDCPTLFMCVKTTFDLPVAPMCVPSKDGDGGVCSEVDAGQPTTMTARAYCSPRYGEPAVDGDLGVKNGVPTSGTGGVSGGTTTGSPVIPPQASGHGSSDEAQDAGVAEGDNADVPEHVQACSVTTPGAGGHSSTWLAVMFSLAAAWVVTRRRR